MMAQTDGVGDMPRVRRSLIRTENKGLSAARKFGMAIGTERSSLTLMTMPAPIRIG